MPLAEFQRFLVTDETPKEGPMFRTAEAWENFSYSYQENRIRIVDVIGQITAQEFFNQLPNKQIEKA